MFEGLQEKAAPHLEKLQDAWESMPDDKKQLARFTAGILSVLLPLIIIVVPMISGHIAANQQISSALEQLDEMRQLETSVLEFGLSEKDTGSVKKRVKKVKSLISILDGIASKVEVSTLVQAMRPIKQSKNEENVEAVELQLKGLVLEEISKLIYEIEMSSENLQIRRLEMNKDVKNPAVLRANIEVAR